MASVAPGALAWGRSQAPQIGEGALVQLGVALRREIVDLDAEARQKVLERTQRFWAQVDELGELARRRPALLSMMQHHRNDRR